MIEASGIVLSLDEGLPGKETLVHKKVACALGVKPEDITSLNLLKRSVDARKKNQVHFVASFRVDFKSAQIEEELLNKTLKGVSLKKHHPYQPLVVPSAPLCTSIKCPVIVGAGPAGLFAALYLARAGLKPLLVERGDDAAQRTRKIQALNSTGILDPNTNIQFGEGGAGTFSDGKLTTNLKNPYCAHVLHWFVEAGAPEEILWQAKPHIGSDNLVRVVTSLREQIIAAGGEVRFNTQMVDLQTEQGSISSLVLKDTATHERYSVETDHLVLAIGHSARDTFGLLNEVGLKMEQKPFSVGVRIEHLQKEVNKAQYGKAANHPALGSADYKFAVRTKEGRGVYTFCMCPGGEVVCAASEETGLATNGMSRFARAQENANSALLVEVNPGDLETNHPLAGVQFQRRVEQAAFSLAAPLAKMPYQAPVQTVGDFLAGTQGSKSKTIKPSYAPGVVWTDLHECFPKFVTDALEEALPLFARKMSCFQDAEAVLTGVETRSSSPVRICRAADYQATMQAVSSNIYPCGEGSGYAGGIMSSAIDGLRVAEALLKTVQSEIGKVSR